ncbi:MAG: 8-amino-7-oxononanoate synthase [Usitatibacter sp.]
MSACLERLRQGIAELDREGLLRHRRTLDSAQGAQVVIDGRRVLNFSGNDYLGLAADPRLAAAAHAAIDAFGTGAGASPLVSGHQRAHREAEERFARFAGVERALLFGSGYAANLGVVTALCGRDAEVFGDRLNHACLNDAAILSRARFTRYPHCDLDALEAALAASRAEVRLVATDTVFSMDGDLAPVAQMLALCERHDAWLLLDDAHGIGVLGDTGRGALRHFSLRSPRVIHMATLGKALGGYGAFVGGAAEVIEWLLQRARTYIYSTALPATAAATATAAMEAIEGDPTRVARLHARIGLFREACAAAALAPMPSASAIQPLPVGMPERAVALSAALFEAGFFVPAIRPPTVPRGTSRLRVSLSAAHSADDVSALVAAIARCTSA